MNYYQFHIGDYMAHTAHLSAVEDCAYRRLLDSYYLTEKALPLDVKACARLVRMREHEEDVNTVLREFFTETPGGWVHARCDEEILKYQDKNAKVKASARASVESRAAGARHKAATEATNVQRTLNERSADASTDVELTNNQEPITNTPPNCGDARKRAAQPTRPVDVPESVWQDFQAIRKAKRAPLTDTALEGIRREAAKAGLGLGDAIAYCCEAGWQGFNACWYAERTAGRAATAPRRADTGETAYQRSMRERIEEVAPDIARRAPAPHQDAADFFRTVDAVARVVQTQAIEVTR